ncbi:hypothetical protein L3Q82_022622 [Scortum barcoo]|uniref:Uncharacterized protein n=1 Tax=Scortum barcoo TaxID=214431 RepID=A0ACB8X2X9_9TELE|nr:hypothetical protein L3Q82_022622 [Scortum barcoo]
MIRDGLQRERSEVRALTSWCQDNNLHLNVSKTKELIVDFRRRQREEHAPLSINGTTVERVSSFRFLQFTSVTHREDPDWLHHRLVQQLHRPQPTVKALQREVKAAQHITRTELPSMEDLYTQRCRKKATKIIKDPSHPATNCSACCRLADGSAAAFTSPRTTRLREASSRRP